MADIVAILHHYGLDISDRFTGWRPVRCVFHDDRTASGSVNVQTGFYKCHACMEQAQDAIGLVMWKEGLDFPSARAFVAKLAGASDSEVRSPARRSKRLSSSEIAASGQADLFSPRRRRRS